MYGIVIFGRHILHILRMKKELAARALTSPSSLGLCQKPSPGGSLCQGERLGGAWSRAAPAAMAAGRGEERG